MDEFTRTREALFALMESLPEATWDTANFASGSVLRISIPVSPETVALYEQARLMFAPR